MIVFKHSKFFKNNNLSLKTFRQIYIGKKIKTSFKNPKGHLRNYAKRHIFFSKSNHSHKQRENEGPVINLK